MTRHAIFAMALATLALPVEAQERKPSHCVAVAGDRVRQASFADPVAEGDVRIRYLGHASFALRTPGGKVLVTDYTGYTGADGTLPDVVTMNNAHGSHWTAAPDPKIPYVLKGWEEDGKVPDYDIDLGEVLIRNVPTDVRGTNGPRRNGNSIFIFEVAGLCIGHLGHLHQIPDEAQYAAMGRIDVLMVPVDSGYTMNLPSMIEVVRRLRSSVVIPMHWFSGRSLDTFVTEMAEEFDVVRLEDSQIDLSQRRLPGRPTIMVLQPQWLP